MKRRFFIMIFALWIVTTSFSFATGAEGAAYAYYYTLFGHLFGLEEEKDKEAFGMTEEEWKKLEEQVQSSKGLTSAYGDEAMPLVFLNDPRVMKKMSDTALTTMKVGDGIDYSFKLLNQALKDSGKAPLSPDATVEEIAQGLSEYADKIKIPIQLNSDFFLQDLNQFESSLNVASSLPPMEEYFNSQNIPLSSVYYRLIKKDYSNIGFVYYDHYYMNLKKDGNGFLSTVYWSRYMDYSPSSDPKKQSAWIFSQEYILKNASVKKFQSADQALRDFYGNGYLPDDVKTLSPTVSIVLKNKSSVFDSLQDSKNKTYGISLSAIQGQKIRPGDVAVYPPDVLPVYKQKEDGTFAKPDVFPNVVQKNKELPIFPGVSNPITQQFGNDVFPGIGPSVPSAVPMPDVLPDIAIPDSVPDVTPQTVPIPQDLPFIGPLLDLLRGILDLMKWIIQFLKDFFNNLLKLLIAALSYLFIPKQGFLNRVYLNLSTYFGDLNPFLKSFEPLFTGHSAGTFDDIYVDLFGSSCKILDGQFVRDNLNFYHKIVRAFMFPLIIFFNFKKILGILNGTGHSDISSSSDLTGSFTEVSK